MTLITCHECSGQISDRSAHCPSCGCPTSARPAEARASESLLGSLADEATSKHTPLARRVWMWIAATALLVFSGTKAVQAYRSFVPRSSTPSTLDGPTVEKGACVVGYSGDATKEDAEKVASLCHDLSDGQQTRFHIYLNQHSRIFRAVVRDNMWRNQGSVAAFKRLAASVAPIIGGFPITLQLLDSRGRGRYSATVEASQPPAGAPIEAQDSRVGVVPAGFVTDEEATALSTALRDAGFSGPAHVVLARDDEATPVSISFVANPVAWQDVKTRGSFVELVRAAASCVGGLPIHMRLLDTNLDERYAETVTIK